MSLWELHARRFARWVRMIGLGLVVVLAAAAAVSPKKAKKEKAEGKEAAANA